MCCSLLLTLLLVGAEAKDEPPTPSPQADQDVNAVVVPTAPAEITKQENAPEKDASEANDPQEPGESPTPEEIQQSHGDPDFLDLFSQPKIKYTGRGYKNQVFRYRLFTPDITGPPEKRPLIVWLHGHGQRGADNGHQLVYLNLIFTEPWDHHRYPFFLLAVQCPRDNDFWTTDSAEADDMVNVLKAILDKTISQHPIDTDRISLSGVSSGGNGCWEMAIRHPDLFSGVAPMGSGGGDNSRLDRLIKLPIWAFHSARDRSVSPDGVRTSVSRLQELGGTVALTEIDTSRHNCWTAAFREHELTNWLLSQKRGEPSHYPPGSLTMAAHLERLKKVWNSATTGWKPLQVLTQFCIPIVVLITIWSARRQRRRRRLLLATGSAS
jgi:predicted esterase